jgi:hypothetical protein
MSALGNLLTQNESFAARDTPDLARCPGWPSQAIGVALRRLTTNWRRHPKRSAIGSIAEIQPVILGFLDLAARVDQRVIIQFIG